MSNTFNFNVIVNNSLVKVCIRINWKMNNKYIQRSNNLMLNFQPCVTRVPKISPPITAATLTLSNIFSSIGGAVFNRQYSPHSACQYILRDSNDFR